MKHSKPSHKSARKALLEEIAGITTMQSGTLAEEWRERPAPDGEGTVRTGPYYKHQVWRDGRNVSRRVPVAEAAQLREDIDNAKRFEQLTGELARINIEHTEELRASEGHSNQSAESKKNSMRRRVRSVSPKRKPSSKKSTPD